MTSKIIYSRIPASTYKRKVRRPISLKSYKPQRKRIKVGNTSFLVGKSYKSNTLQRSKGDVQEAVSHTTLPSGTPRPADNRQVKNKEGTLSVPALGDTKHGRTTGNRIERSASVNADNPPADKSGLILMVKNKNNEEHFIKALEIAKKCGIEKGEQEERKRILRLIEKNKWFAHVVGMGKEERWIIIIGELKKEIEGK